MTQSFRDFRVPMLRAAFVVALLTALALGLAYQVRSRVVIDIGGAQDTPFVVNFFDSEDDTQQTFRWTRAESQVQLDGQALTTPWTLRVRMNGYRPAPQPQVQVYLNGVAAGSFQTTDGWKIYTVRGTVPANSLTGDTILEFTTDTFIPQKVYQGSTDPRKLGVATDWVQLMPARSKTTLGTDDYWIDLGMAPVLPPPLTVASWTLGVALLYITARGVGLPRRGVNLAAGILIVGLAVGLAFLRPALGLATGEFLTLSLVLAVFAGVLAALLPRLDARFVARTNPSARLDARSVSILCAIVLLSIALKWGGVWYPQFRSSDLTFHTHRLQFVAQGNLFFTSELPDAVHRIVPYPPALYLVLTPVTPWFQDGAPLLLIFNALADAAAILAVYLAARNLFGSNAEPAAGTRPALIAAFLFAFSPIAYWVYSWGNHTNIFGQDVATILFAALLTLPLARPRNFLLALFLFLLAATAHLGVFLSLLAFFPLAVIFRFFARDQAARRETIALVLLFGIGLALAWGLYYAEFTDVLFAQTQTYITDFGAGRTTSGGGITVARAVSVVRSILDQVGWVLLGLGIVGVPLLWRRVDARARAVWGAWLLVGFLFALVTLGSSFSTRYTLWAAPALALSGGLAIAWLFPRGRAFQFAVYVLCALALTQTVWIWVDRVLNGYH